MTTEKTTNENGRKDDKHAAPHPAPAPKTPKPRKPVNKQTVTATCLRVLGQLGTEEDRKAVVAALGALV